MQKEKCSKNFNSGFTLLELLVVVLIIGILAAIALPQYRKAVVKAKLAQLDVITNTAKKNIELYLNTHGWPTTNSSIYFTGTNSVAEIEIDCNSRKDYWCFTDSGAFYSSCNREYCRVHFQSAPWIGGSMSLNLELSLLNNVWHANGIERSEAPVLKNICPYLAERNISAEAPSVAACESVGVTLKEYQE